MRRSRVVALSAIAALVVSGTAVRAREPGPAARPASPTAAVFVHAVTVHLITGARARVLTRADGTTTSSLLAPDAATPVARFQTPTGSYLLPRTTPAERRRLDPSLFDLTAVAAAGRRVPVEVTFGTGVQPDRLPGLRLDLNRSRPATRGSTVVRGSYGARYAGLRPGDLRGVESIRLAGPAASVPVVAGPTHSLTVQVADPQGGAVGGDTVLIENVQDSSLFAASANTADSGAVTMQVPDGPYAVFAFSFSRLAILPEVVVSADQTVSLDLGAATVKPHTTYPGARSVDTSIAVTRAPATGFAIPVSFSGPHFFVRVQPTAPDVTDGSLETGTSATLVPRGTKPPYGKLIVSGTFGNGVPATLDDHLVRRDTARVVARTWADGNAGVRATEYGVAWGQTSLFTGHDFDTKVPGRQVTLVQASPHVFYQQTFLPLADGLGHGDAAQLISFRAFSRAGRTHRLDLGHAPVGPGVEGRADYPGAIRLHDRMRIFLPLFEGAGSDLVSFLPKHDGGWSLSRGARRIATGHHWIALHPRVPRARHSYRLIATSHPHSAQWSLSTLVRDDWVFHSDAHHPRIRILTPTYLPPVTAYGELAPGRTSYRLTFHDLVSSRRVTHARVEISTDDGSTWRAVDTRRTGSHSFRVDYQNPAARRGARFVSIRVTAAETGGSTVQETAIRAYRLR